MRRLLKNDYALSIISKIVLIGTGFLTSSFSTRYLGLAFKGEYGYITQIVNVLVLILNFGFYQSYSYNFRREGDLIYKKYISLFVYQFICYGALAVCMAGITRSFTVCMVAMLTPFQVLKIQMDNIMLVQNVRMRLYANISSALMVMICYFMLYQFAPSGIFPIVAVTVAIDILVILVYLLSERTAPKIKSLSTVFMKQVARFGFLPMLSTLLVTLNYSVDIFFLKRMASPIELSMYSTAAGVMNYVWLVPDAFKDILFSRVARNDKKNSVAFSVKVSLLILVVITIGFVIFGKLFLSIMYGSPFLPAYGVILVLFLGVYSMVFFKLFGIVFLAEGKRVAHFLILLTSVTINMILNYFLIPKFGMYGAAYASVGSYNICGILFLWYYAKSSGQKMRDFVLITKTDIEAVKSVFRKKI